MLGVQAQLDEPLGEGGGLAVGAHMNGRVRVVDADQTDGALHALQQSQVDAVGLADLPRRHVRAVVADDVAGGQQQRRIGRPDLLGGDALLEEPPHQFGPFRARGSLEPFEQVVDGVVVPVVHVANVQRGAS